MTSDIASQASALRAELKAWEKDFAARHDGRRAAREDIKAAPEISFKYKEYGRLHDILHPKPATEKAAPKPSHKRKMTEDVFKTPSKRRPRNATTTPSQASNAAAHTTYESPAAVRQLATPTPKRSMIGPTPQKDGVFLGLFDCLSEGTPVRSERTALGVVEPNVLQTPSRTRTEEDGSRASGRRKFDRTPMSEGKRFLLDSIVTPLKRKHGPENTPTSSAKHDSTPQFLRRDNFVLDAVPEEDDIFNRMSRPRSRRPFGRSFSSFLRTNMPQAEPEEVEEPDDETLEDEYEALREAERAEAGWQAPSQPKVPEIQVEATQVEMALGPDGGLGSDEDIDNDQKYDEGSPARTWKKKGAKRQTRRAILRPTRHRARPPPETGHPTGDEEDGVPETQTAEEPHPREEDEDGSEFEDGTTGSKSTRPNKNSQAQPTGKQATKGTELAKKKPRKVNELAHANFHKLKIKNKNSKAQGRGRFGRGRR